MEVFEVVHVPERSRYELREEGRTIGYADALLRGDQVVVPHVEVDPAYEGKGLGSRLVKGLISDSEAKGLKIVPLCPFARAVAERVRRSG